jgi:CTP:molybdopterin cytidylyltransferase MocA
VIAGVVLAAGASRRFGGVKQLVQYDGKSLLGHAIASMEAVTEVDETVVVLGANAQAIMQVVPLGRARVVVCRHWEEGISASIRAGLEAVPEAEAAVLTLADQPLVGSAAIERVVRGRDGTGVVGALYRQGPGYPVLLERSAFDLADSLSGEVGAETLLEGPAALSVDCDDVASPADVDSPPDLARLRQVTGLQKPKAV